MKNEEQKYGFNQERANKEGVLHKNVCKNIGSRKAVGGTWLSGIDIRNVQTFYSAVRRLLLGGSRRGEGGHIWGPTYLTKYSIN